MSGAKVVKVKTKKEMQAICLRQIGFLNETIDKCKKYAYKNDLLTADFQDLSDSISKQIPRMLDQENFTGLQIFCNQEIINFQNHYNQLREKVVTKAELANNSRRNLLYSTHTLIKSLMQDNDPIPDCLSEIIETVMNSDDKKLEGLRSTFSKIMLEHTHRPLAKVNLTPLQLKLSNQFIDGQNITTLEEWKKDFEIEARSDVDLKIDRLFAEAEADGDSAVIQPFVLRFERLLNESSSVKRSLLKKSLLLDMIDFVKKQKSINESLIEMNKMKSELTVVVSDEARKLEGLLVEAIENRNVSNVELLCERAQILVKTDTNVKAAGFRRGAILKGLAELGYEVNEHLETAWVNKGRIVVKKCDEQDYGVEIGAIENAEMIQIQLVSFKQDNDAAKDLNRETTWCSEFSNLKNIVQKSGIELHVEKAVGSGVNPVKRVESPLASISDRNKSKNITSRQKKIYE
jgi:hypothetical protein